MKNIIIFLALLCGAASQDATTFVITKYGQPSLRNPTIDEVYGWSPELQAEAKDVVKAMKLLDMEREILELMIGLFVSDAPTAEKLKRADAYAADREKRTERIAWARAVLVKWEARVK